MRIKLSNRLALLAAVGVVATTIGAAAAPATQASPLQYLTASDFRPVALQGFGDPQDTFAWSMNWFNNKLYVGTNEAFLCASYAMFARSFPLLSNVYPPQDSDLAVPCNPDPQALPEAGQIWAMDPSVGSPITQSNWTKVYQSPYNVTVTITQTNALTLAARDIAYRGITVYTDTNGQQAMYISGVGGSGLNGPQVPPPSLLRSTDGVNFTAVPADPGTTMGSINQFNCCIRGAVAYNGPLGKFYMVIGNIGGAGQVFVSPDPRLGDNSFQQLTPPDMTVFELEPFNGHLYVGTQSSAGYQVLELIDSGPGACTSLPCPDSAFKTIVPAGGGLGANNNIAVTSMHVFTDSNNVPHLYVGSATRPSSNAIPVELVRVNPDDSWQLIVGNPRVINGVPVTSTSSIPSGFGWFFNDHMWRMEDYNGVLYVGTFNDATTYKSTPAGAQLRSRMGFNLWASPDGLSFFPVTLNGFGDPFAFGARTMQKTPDGLFLGTANDWKGLQIWQGSVSTSALQLASPSLQIDDATSSGAPALAWDAASGATLYHVYRATDVQTTIPPRPATAPDPDFPTLSAIRNSASNTSHKVLLPGAYTEIGTTANTYFVDHQAQAGGHYSYYVVTQDAAGHLSAPSPVASNPYTLPAATFGSVQSLVSSLSARHHLSAAMATQGNRGMQTAYSRLHAGDVQGTRAALEQQRRAILASAQGAVGRFYAETAADAIKRLETRLSLVAAHVVSPDQLH